MDVVYRYRFAGDGEELRYSLRSLKNIPHDSVWIVGDWAPWLKDVNHIKVNQSGGSKWLNSRRNLISACSSKKISDDFILMDDDFYIVQKLDAIPTHHRGSLKKHAQVYHDKNIRSSYASGFEQTYNLMRKYGFEEPIFSYELHAPMVINKELFNDSYRILRREKSLPTCFHIRSWYGNYAQIGGTKAGDVKVGTGTQLKHMRKNNIQEFEIPEGPFLSTSNVAFHNANFNIKDYLNQLFPDKSPYER